MSHSDYTDFTVANAVTIVQACLDAGQPNLIVPALLDRRSSGSVVAELTAARSTRSPAAAAASTTDQLSDVIARRFKAQNARG